MTDPIHNVSEESAARPSGPRRVVRPADGVDDAGRARRGTERRGVPPPWQTVTMPEEDLETVQRELATTRAQRDELRRELGDLRAWLCIKLGIGRDDRSRDEVTSLCVATDAEILGEVQRLQDELATFTSTEEAEERRWSGIDALIMENRRIHAIQAIRTEFGTSLRLAVDLLNERYTRLRRRRPDRFSESADTYWDGFHSF
ncbi:hypothetical protein PYK79_13660 [Streptomyces sp. ID05-04B]|nr:hypothetical protein [Streptomyces sp. ID05-04B]